MKCALIVLLLSKLECICPNDDVTLSGPQEKGDFADQFCDATVGNLGRAAKYLGKAVKKISTSITNGSDAAKWDDWSDDPTTTPDPSTTPEPLLFEDGADSDPGENAIEQYEAKKDDDEKTLDALANDNKAEKHLKEPVPTLVSIDKPVDKLFIKDLTKPFDLKKVSEKGPLQELAEKLNIKDTSAHGLQAMGVKKLMESAQFGDKTSVVSGDVATQSEKRKNAKNNYILPDVDHLVNSPHTPKENKTEKSHIPVNSSPMFKAFANSVKYSDTTNQSLKHLTNGPASIDVVEILKQIAPGNSKLDKLKKQLPKEAGGLSETAWSGATESSPSSPPVKGGFGTMGDMFKYIQNALPTGINDVKGFADLGSLGSGLTSGIGSITEKLGIDNLAGTIGNLGNLGDLGKSLNVESLGKAMENLKKVGDLGKNIGQIGKTLKGMGVKGAENLAKSVGGGMIGDLTKMLDGLGIGDLGKSILSKAGDGGITDAFKNFKDDPMSSAMGLLNKIPGGQLASFGDQMVSGFGNIVEQGKDIFKSFKGIANSVSSFSSIKDLTKTLTGGLGSGLGDLGNIGNTLTASFGDFGGILGKLENLGGIGKNLAAVTGSIGDIGKAMGGLGDLGKVVGSFQGLTSGILSNSMDDKTTSLKNGLSTMTKGELGKTVGNAVGALTNSIGLDLNFGGMDLQQAFSNLQTGKGMAGFTEGIAKAGFKYMTKEVGNAMKSVPFGKEIGDLLGEHFDGDDLSKQVSNFMGDLGSPEKMGKRLCLMAESVMDPEKLKDGFLDLAGKLPNPIAAIKGLGIDKLGSRLVSFAGEKVEKLFDGANAFSEQLGGMADMAGGFVKSFGKSLSNSNSSRKDALLGPLEDMAKGFGGKLPVNIFGGMMKDVTDVRSLTKNVAGMFGANKDGFLGVLGDVFGDFGKSDAMNGVLGSLGNLLGGEKGLNGIMGQLGGLLSGENGGFGGVINKFSEMLDNGDYSGLLGNLGGMLGGKDGGLGGVLNGASGMFNGNIGEGLGGMLNSIGGMLGGANIDVSGIVNGLGSAMKGDWKSGAKDALKGITGMVGQMVGEDSTTGGIMKIIGNIAGGEDGGIVGGVGNIIEKFKSKDIGGAITSVTDMLSKDGALGGLNDMLGGGNELQSILGAVSGVTKGIQSITKNGKDGIGGAIGSFGEALGSFGGMFGEDVSKYMTGAGKIIGNVADMAKNFKSGGIAGLAGGAKDVLANVGDMVGGQAGSIIGGAGGIISNVADMIKNRKSLSGLAKGAQGIMGDIGSMFGDGQVSQIFKGAGGIIGNVADMVNNKSPGGIIGGIGGIIGNVGGMFGQDSEVSRIMGGIGNIAGNVGKMVQNRKSLSGLASGMGGILGDVGGMISSDPKTQKIFSGIGGIVSNLGPMFEGIKKSGSVGGGIQSAVGGAAGILKSIGGMFDDGGTTGKVMDMLGTGAEAVAAIAGLFGQSGGKSGESGKDGGGGINMAAISGGAKAAGKFVDSLGSLIGDSLGPEVSGFFNGFKKDGIFGGVGGILTQTLGQKGGAMGDIFGEGGVANKVLGGMSDVFNSVGGIEGIVKVFKGGKDGGMDYGQAMKVGAAALGKGREILGDIVGDNFAGDLIKGDVMGAIGKILPFDDMLGDLKGFLGASGGLSGLFGGEGGGLSSLLGGLGGGGDGKGGGFDLSSLTGSGFGDQFKSITDSFGGMDFMGGFFGGGGSGGGGGGFSFDFGGGGGAGGGGGGGGSGGGQSSTGGQVGKAILSAAMEIFSAVMGYCGEVESYYQEKKQRQSFLKHLDRLKGQIQKVIEYFDTATQTFIDAADEVAEGLKQLAKRVDKHTQQKVIDQFRQYQRLSSTVLELYTDQMNDMTRKSQFKAACDDPQNSPEFMIQELIRILGSSINYFDIVMEQGFYTDDTFQQALHLSSGNMNVILGAWMACDKLQYKQMPRVLERKLQKNYAKQQDSVFDHVERLNKKREKIYFSSYILQNPQINIDKSFRGRHTYMVNNYEKFEVDTYNYNILKKYTYSLEFGGEAVRRLIIEPEFDIVYDPDFVSILTKPLTESFGEEDEALLQFKLLHIVRELTEIRETTLGIALAFLHMPKTMGDWCTKAARYHKGVLLAETEYFNRLSKHNANLAKLKGDCKAAVKQQIAALNALERLLAKEKEAIKACDDQFDEKFIEAHKKVDPLSVSSGGRLALAQQWKNRTCVYHECYTMWGCAEAMIKKFRQNTTFWKAADTNATQLIKQNKKLNDSVMAYSKDLDKMRREQSVNPFIVSRYADIMSGLLEATIPRGKNLSIYLLFINNCATQLKSSPYLPFNLDKNMTKHSELYTESTLFFFIPANTSEHSSESMRFMSSVFPKALRHLDSNASRITQSVDQVVNRAGGFKALLKKLLTMIPYKIWLEHEISIETMDQVNNTVRIDKINNLIAWIDRNLGYKAEELVKKRRHVVHVVRSRVNSVDEYIPPEIIRDVKRYIRLGASISAILKKFRCRFRLYRLISVYETVLKGDIKKFRYPFKGFGRCYSQIRTTHKSQVVFCYFKDHNTCDKVDPENNIPTPLVKCQLNYDKDYGCNKDIISAAQEDEKKMWSKNDMVIEPSFARLARYGAIEKTAEMIKQDAQAAGKTVEKQKPKNSKWDFFVKIFPHKEKSAEAKLPNRPFCSVDFDDISDFPEKFKMIGNEKFQIS